MCYTPFYRKDDPTTPLPCGRCERCSKRRVSAWSFRLMKQFEQSYSAYFITLTYASPPMTRNGFMTLVKKDVQDWMMRLREHDRDHGDRKIRYYMVGEYGSIGDRPHYHAIVFDINCPAIKLGEQAGKAYYHIQSIADSWKLGTTFIGAVADASVGYTLKYVSKPHRIPVHNRDDRQKEFSLMSKKMGLNYLSPAVIQWHKDNLYERMFVPLKDGKKIAMPRYYKDKLYSDIERSRILAHAKKDLAKKDKEQRDKDGDRHEELKHARAKQAIRRQTLTSKKNDKL